MELQAHGKCTWYGIQISSYEEFAPYLTPADFAGEITGQFSLHGDTIGGWPGEYTGPITLTAVRDCYIRCVVTVWSERVARWLEVPEGTVLTGTTRAEFVPVKWLPLMGNLGAHLDQSILTIEATSIRGRWMVSA